MIDPLPSCYLDHLLHPRGMGDLIDPDAAGEVGSMVGGLGVRVTVRYAPPPDGADERPKTIAALAGRSFGNPALIPPISFLAATFTGASVDDAHDADPALTLSGLGEGDPSALPPAVHRGAAFVHRALAQALETPKALGPGVLVCRCLGVGDRSVRAAIHAGAHTPEAIGLDTRACTGCRTCRPDLLAILDEELEDPWPKPQAGWPTLAKVAWVLGGPVLRGLGLPLAGVRATADGLAIALDPPRKGALTTPAGAAAQVRYLLRETTGRDVTVVVQSHA